ncbi:MAG TPA: PAS domain S-box protein [Anaerolineales bacterium]|nr:PAS domain S-box protein [Anaerolineales bacterium]
MSVKTPRKTKVKPTYKVSAVKKVRGSAPKTTSKSNGKRPLAAYEHLHIGIVEASLTGKYVDVNQEFCRILGYSKKELLRLGVRDCTHEDDYGLDIKLHKQLVAGEIPFYALEKRYIRKDGSLIWVELTRSLVCDEEGKPLCTMGVVIDISERKQVESVLRESVEHLRLATEAARMFKWEFDFQKQLYTLADNFVQVLGFSAGLLPQNSVETLARLSPPEDLQAISEKVAKAIENRTDLNSLQCRVIDPEDGQIVWLEVNAKVVYDEAGNPQRMFGVAQNITEDMQKEKKLRESETKYSTLFNSIDEGFCVIEKVESKAGEPLDFRYVAANPAFAIQAGVGNIVGKTIRQAFPGEPEEWLETYDTVLRTGEALRFERGLITQGRVLELYAFRVEDTPQQHVAVIFKNITERKRAEQALAEFARQQAALYRLSDELHHADSLEDVYNAALNAILGALQCDRASILLFDDTDVMRFVAWRGLSDGYRKATEGHSPWRVDEKNPQPICVNDIHTAELSDALKAIVQADGIRSLAFIPLVANGKLIGKFMVYFDTPHSCSDDEIELSMTIAQQLAFGIDRNRAEAELRTSEERYRTIVSTANEGIWYIDLNAETVYLNEPMAHILGYSVPEVIGRKAPEFCFAEDRSALEMRIANNYQGKYESFDFRFRRKDGSAVLVLGSTSPVRGGTGNVIGALGMFADVTERKRVEEQLRKSAEFDAFRVALTDALRTLNDPEKILAEAMRVLSEKLQVDRVLYSEINDETILILDNHVNQGVPKLIGRASLNDYGKARGSLSAGQNLIIVDATTSPVMDEKDRAAFTALGIRSGLGIPLIKDGHWVATLGVHHSTVRAWTENEIKFAEETAERTWSALERARAQEKLHASETLYRVIAGSIPGGGVYVVDKDFRYLVAEGSVSEAFGLSRPMLEGHTVSEVFPDERGARMEERLRRTFAGETVSFETKHNGRVYWTQQAPLLDSIGQAIILTVDITERKQAEEALRQSEERFVRFMQHLPGPAWIKDVEGRYVYANATAEKAFGTPRAKLYGKTDLEIFPPEVAAQFMKNDKQALIGEKGVQTVETLRQDDGILHYSLVNKFPIPGSDGSAALIGGTAFDITERLRAEEALHESEQRLRAILNQATAGIVRKDAEGCLIFVNDAFCNMLGYTESELLGKPIWQLTHHGDVEENRRLFDQLMLEGVPFKLEKRLLRRDGSIMWVDVSVSPIVDAAGKPQSAVAVEVDITARKQAEEALQQLNLQLESRVQKRTATIQAMNQSLRDEIAERKRVEEALRVSEATARESEEKLRTLFDLLPVGISFLDPEGQVLQLNSALLNIVRLSRVQLINQEYKARKYIRADGTPMSLSEFASARALAEARTIYNVETGIVLENGEVIWTSVSAAPVEVADVGVVVVTVDITESKRAERELQESYRRLGILSRRLVEVQEQERHALARELHDRVGQTLAALNINLIIINSQLPADIIQQIGPRLNDSMKLVAETIALVRDVMTDLRPAVLDDYGLEAALESQLSKFTSRYSIGAVLEKSDRPIPRLGSSIEMTFLRIAQEALMNIARHAHAEHVNLKLQQDEQVVGLSIQDDGIGIESWQDANRPGSHGLTIMRERAEAFGGRLRVKSVPGQGTIVEVSIPFKNDGQGLAGKEERL